MGNQKEDLWTVLRMLEWATEYFIKKKIPDPRHSIEWLLAEVLNCKRLDLYLSYERPLSPSELKRLRLLIKRRATHEPLQYIIGYTEFMNCRIEVNPSVLIPRIETEQLVELLLEKTADRHADELNLLDMGSGSGCIPIAIKKKVPRWTCNGLDISENALLCAKKNASINDTEVLFFKGDIFNVEESEAGQKKWDIIISNPPYIQLSEKTTLQEQVLKFEPEEALFHDNPLSVYQSLTEFAHAKKTDLFLEINNHLAGETLRIVKQKYPDAQLHKDLDNNSRFISAII